MGYLETKISDRIQRIAVYAKEGWRQFQAIGNITDFGLDDYTKYNVLYVKNDSEISFVYRDLLIGFKIDQIGNISMGDQELPHSEAIEKAKMVLEILIHRIAEDIIRENASKSRSTPTTVHEIELS